MANEWFNAYTPGLNPCDRVDPSPRDTVTNVCQFFYEDVKLKGYAMSVARERFMRIMYEGMCTLYDQHMKNEMQNLSPAQYSFPCPPGWSPETESIWLDYLHCRVFDLDYWDAFWGCFKECDWEEAVHSWRAEFQALMPLYIYRTFSPLVAEGLITLPDDSPPDSSEDEHEGSSHDDYYNK